tara:strand:+ start:119 stop:697 length:579 start_codon:yes stop_codon:yes gene_type:complete
MPGPSDPISIGQRVGASAYTDPRSDLGYGRSEDKFHKPRSKGGAFPYPENDDYADVEPEIEDEELLRKLVNKMMNPGKSHDSLIGRSADRDSKANGNKPIGPPLGEAGVGMVPYPDMYKKRIQVGGGVTSPTAIRPGGYQRTGSKKGWSQAPVSAEDEANVEFSDIESGEDPNLVKLRKVISGIINQQNMAD